MPGDLVGGGYPLSYSFRKSLGLQANAAQANIGARSNLEWPQIAGDLTDAAASLVSGKLTLIPVPVEVGDVIASVAVAVGATAASTPTHQWVALYSGILTTPALQGAQSTDGTTAVIAASALYKFTLATAVIVTPAIAPYGYIYAGISATASTVPSLIGGNVATAAQYARFTDAPPFWAATYSSALGATAPATVTLASATAIATVPEVYLY